MGLEFKRLSKPLWRGRRKHALVRHGDHLVLLGGFCLESMATPINLNDVWRTYDGESWERLTESGETSLGYYQLSYRAVLLFIDS